MLIQMSFLLLPFAATFGWYMGRKEQEQAIENPNEALLRKDYFKGLNYLINEQPDKAVDVFIKLLEVDSDTVETHLALGNLFRRRGEVDRAIRVHQNLIARPQLDQQDRAQALSALGQDYLHAGVLDRAERLFLELVKINTEDKQSLNFLLHIYQKEKDWEKAIQIAYQLENLEPHSMAVRIAQYYCELAEKEVGNQAQKYLDQAQNVDPLCVRANLIKGTLALKNEQYLVAITAYQQVKLQDPDYLSEIIQPLGACYRYLDQESIYMDYLKACLKEYPRIAMVLAITQYLERHENTKAAIDFLATQIQRQPSLRGLGHLVSLYLSNSTGDTQAKLDLLKNFIDLLLNDKPVYQCLQCGFSSKTLFWLCPSCNHWASIKPIQGLEGN